MAIIGAGIVGLSTAWFLQDHGVNVTLFDRGAIGGGATTGNAGWITPGMAAPLSDPSVLRGAGAMLFSRDAAVSIRPSLDANLLRFLLGFIRNSTDSRWQRGMAAFAQVNRHAFEAFDDLHAAGVSTEAVHTSSILAAWTDPEQRKTLVSELHHMAGFGLHIDAAEIDGAEARSLQPILSEQIEVGLLMRDQRFVDPSLLSSSIATSISRRGGHIIPNSAITGLSPMGRGVEVTSPDGTMHFDQVVVATGAELGRLARPFGVKTVVQAGRGYSFTVSPEDIPTTPIYLPHARLACTPLDGRLRIAGLMEFSKPDASFLPRRTRAMANAASGLLDGVDFAARENEWVGSRPVTPDGLPLIGRTREPRIHVAGGHGMWGVTLGPITGKLLARQIATGEADRRLQALEPTRSGSRRTAPRRTPRL